MRRHENDPLLASGSSDTTRNDNKNFSDFGRVSKQLSRNLVTKAALATQLGLLIIVGTLYHRIATNPVILFSGHPIFNSLGLLILGQGILLVQPPPQSTQHKTVQGHLHGIINTLSVFGFGTGSFFIFYNKSLHGAEHITTWHARFGLATYMLLLTVLVFGVAQYWTPELVFGSVARAKSMYKYHRLAGYFVLALALVTVFLATDSDYNHNVLNVSPTAVLFGSVLVVGGVFSQVKTAKVKFW